MKTVIVDEQGKYSREERVMMREAGIEVRTPDPESVFERIDAIRKKIANTDTMKIIGLGAVQRLQEEMGRLMLEIPDITL